MRSVLLSYISNINYLLTVCSRRARWEDDDYVSVTMARPPGITWTQIEVQAAEYRVSQTLTSQAQGCGPQSLLLRSHAELWMYLVSE